MVVVTGLDAVGNRLEDVAHRPDLVSAITGRGLNETLTPEDVATVIGHQTGGLALLPNGARVVVALTQLRPETAVAAASIETTLRGRPRIDRVCTFAGSANGAREVLNDEGRLVQQCVAWLWLPDRATTRILAGHMRRIR